MSNAAPKLGQYYADDFYHGQMDGSVRSARLYVGHMWRFFQPRSVANLGCGRGTWLQAFREAGSERVVGFDGVWNTQANMVDPAIQFIGADLNQPLSSEHGRFDLAVSLEVAEHIEAARAATFVGSLTGLADAVLFGAAYTQQGGTNHINEQPPTYWAALFKAQGYVPYDLFRPTFWGNKDIEFWYQQNSFLYVKEGVALNQTLQAAGYAPIANTAFMDCVHPSMYASKLRRPPSAAQMRFKVATKRLKKQIRAALGIEKKRRG